MRQEVPKDLFKEKHFFAKVPENSVFLYTFFPLLLTSRLLHIFEISAKFGFFWYPLRTILKKFFSTLIRGGATFLEDKSPIR
jgi:hypothetical protein